MKRAVLAGCLILFVLFVVVPIAGCSWYVHDYDVRADRACGNQPQPKTAAQREQDKREATELQALLKTRNNPLDMRVDHVVGHRAYFIERNAQGGRKNVVERPTGDYGIMYDEARYLGSWLEIFRAHHPNDDPRGSAVFRRHDGRPYEGGYAQGTTIECEPWITL